MLSINVVRVNYEDEVFRKHILYLMQHYAVHALEGKELSEFTKNNLLNCLAQTPGAITLIGYIDSTPISLANCFIGLSTFNAKKLLNIHDLVVIDRYRGQGAAQKMLEAAEREARELDCCKLTLEVLDTNLFAQAAYRKYGFTDYGLTETSKRTFFWQKHLKGISKN